MNGFFFEIIAKTPVPQHLKHSVVIGINPHFFQIVVFARNTQAFLGIGNAVAFGCGIS